MEEKRLKIGATIGRLRRNKGLTQQELAELLGVSPAAVSKWETDRAWPELPMLGPLARALDTNVDALLAFEPSLTGRQAAEKIEALLESAGRLGADQAEQSLETLLRQYPGCAPLQYNAALAWDALQLLFPEAEPQRRRRWTERKKQLLEQVLAPKSGDYWQNAAWQLAALALNEKRPDQARRLLESLPQGLAETEILWSRLYREQNQPEKALEILQKRLFSLACQQLNCLTAMLDPKLTADSARRMEICQVYSCLDRLFGLGGLAEGLFFQLFVEEKRWEQAAQALEGYAQALLQYGANPNKALFFPAVKAKPGNPEMGRRLRELLLQELKDPQYQPLMAFPSARRALAALETGPVYSASGQGAASARPPAQTAPASSLPSIQ